MSYYSDLPWWDTSFKIRRFITISTPADSIGDETLAVAKFLKSSLLGKVKSDYSDLIVVFNNVETVPFYTLDEGTYVSVVFELKEPISGISQDEYCLYMSNKTKARLTTDDDILDPDAVGIVNTNDPNEQDTRWLFTRPTVDWSSGLGIKAGARALFEFIGHKAQFRFKVGPTKGKFVYSVNDSAEIEVDAYSEAEAVQTLIDLDEAEIKTYKVRVKVLGERASASSGVSVEIADALHHQIVLSELQAEEFYSEIGQTLLVPRSG